jgi:hypothetical protein
LNNAYDGPNNSNNLCAIHFAEASNDPELIVDHIAPPPSPPPPPPPPPSFPAGGIQNVTYEYDAVGNITKTTDYSNSSTSKIVYYGYDDLYRLTSASTTYASTSPDYKHTFGYSALGNIATSSAQGTYSYDGSGSKARFLDLFKIQQGRPALAFIGAQLFNIIWTLLWAYLLFGGVLLRSPDIR